MWRESRLACYIKMLLIQVFLYQSELLVIVIVHISLIYIVSEDQSKMRADQLDPNSPSSFRKHVSHMFP